MRSELQKQDYLHLMSFCTKSTVNLVKVNQQTTSAPTSKYKRALVGIYTHYANLFTYSLWSHNAAQFTVWSPRQIRPHLTGRKLHLCSHPQAWVEPLGVSDVTDNKFPWPHPARLSPNLSVPFQHSNHISQPSTHTQHINSREENIISLLSQ